MRNCINVIYLTTKCNFKCKYCYEGQKSNDLHKTLTNEEIENAVDNFITEKGTDVEQHIVCLFGGEPFLNFEGMKHYMKYIERYADRTKYGIASNVISNGSLLHNCIPELKEWILHPKKNIYFSLDISYDGAFQKRRTTSDITEQNMLLLKKEGIPFGISYTITNENCRSEQYLPDFMAIAMKFLDRRGDMYKIRVNLDRKCIEDELKITYHEFMQKMSHECEYIFFKTGLRICEFSCKKCGRCNFNNDKKRYYLPETDIIMEDMVTEEDFDHFKKAKDGK